MKNFKLAGMMLAVLFMGLPLWSAEPEPTEPTKPEVEDASFWMRRKLELSKDVFASLATGDYATIKKSAESMGKLSQFEGFVRGQNPEYRTQLELFRLANKELIRQADQENIDGATLAFHQLTMSCVNCHKQLRSQEK